MNPFSPIVGSILQSSQAQRLAAGDRVNQVRRAQQFRRSIAIAEEQLDHQVESSEELQPIHEDRDEDHTKDRRPKRDQQDSKDNEPRLDITA
jgi:hypothetical protein